MSKAPGIAASLVFLWIFAQSSFAETGYVSDNLSVPLRSGASSAHRIINAGLPSGTRLEILETDPENGFTQIRTARGTLGWMRTQYIVHDLIARDRLKLADAEIASLHSQLDSITLNLEQTNRERTASLTANETLQSQISTLDSELLNIKQISQNALRLDEQNRSMTKLNERLREEVKQLIEDRNQLENNLQQRWLLIGAGLIFAGLLLGLVIKSRPRRSGWS